MRETRFKDTEIGKVPVDWNVMPLENLFSIGNGYTPSKAEPAFWRQGTIPWFRMEDIRENGRILKDSIQHITPLAVKGRGLFPAGSIIISTTATIGEHALLIADSLANQRFTFLWNVNRCYKADSIYLFYHCFLLGEWCRKNTNFGGLTAVNMPAFKRYPFPLPSLPEQRRIAAALSGVDKLISCLDKKIEKKKLIKQGTMQQLLTGKKRLQGFDEPWVEVKLGEIWTIQKGQPLQSKDFEDGLIPVIAGGKTPAGFHNKANIHMPSITISASGAYAGYVWLHHEEIFASDCFALLGNDKCDLLFLYYFLKNVQDEIYKSQLGGAQPHVHPKDVQDFTFSHPTIAEQRAIASVLTSMDEDIAKLEARRDKYKQVKQGMMQQLLTGRIRLVETETTANEKTQAI